MKRVTLGAIALALTITFASQSPASAGPRCGFHRHFVPGHYVHGRFGHRHWVPGHCV